MTSMNLDWRSLELALASKLLRLCGLKGVPQRYCKALASFSDIFTCVFFSLRYFDRAAWSGSQRPLSHSPIKRKWDRTEKRRSTLTTPRTSRVRFVGFVVRGTRDCPCNWDAGPVPNQPRNIAPNHAATQLNRVCYLADRFPCRM